MRHQFVRLLGRGIEADRMIDIVGVRERQLGVGAIDRRRRRKDQMLAAVVPAAFQHVEEALQVGVDIGVRIAERMAHAGLRGEMHDMRKSVLGEQRRGARRGRQDRA